MRLRSFLDDLFYTTSAAISVISSIHELFLGTLLDSGHFDHASLVLRCWHNSRTLCSRVKGGGCFEGSMFTLATLFHTWISWLNFCMWLSVNTVYILSKTCAPSCCKWLNAWLNVLIRFIYVAFVTGNGILKTFYLALLSSNYLSCSTVLESKCKPKECGYTYVYYAQMGNDSTFRYFPQGTLGGNVQISYCRNFL